MTSARRWLQKSFLSAFALLILTQILVLSLGTGAVLKAYARRQSAYLEELARAILIDPSTVTADAPDYAGPFFVFSADGSLVYSNRGKGRSIPEADYRPVLLRGEQIGRYYAGEIRFLSNEANRILFISMLSLTAFSMLFSTAIAAAAALRSSRRIAGPVETLQRDIGVLRRLEEVEARRFAIREMSDISQSLNQVSRLLAGEEENKRQWMQNIAHDLRTPLSGLRSQLEGMRDGVLETTPQRFDRTLAELSRLEEMTASIAELYRLEQLDEIAAVPVDAAELLSETIAPFESAAAQKNITLSAGPATGAVEADPALLLRALRNIVDNGMRYSPPGSTISVAIETAEGGRPLIIIANDGPRLPEDQLERIFQRFYRGEFSRTTPGSGLGLNIAREIARRHGGEIEVRNLEPTGVEFRVRL